MTILYLVRHGHTVWHDTGGVAGRTDIALSDAGRAAVRALHDAVPVALSYSLSRAALHVSPLQRTRETAAILFPRRRDAVLDARLVELDFGDWEGSTWEAVHRDHGAALAAWGRDWVSRSPPNGERFSEQISRCRAWLDDAIGAADADGSDTIVAVTHGGSVRALLSELLELPAERAMRFSIDPARVCRLDRESAGWRLRAANLDRFV